MNYAKVKEVSELKKRQKELAKMSGSDRTKLEEHIISEAKKEVKQEPVEEKEVQQELAAPPKAQGKPNGPNNRR
jgi:hypothetical protein